MSAVLSRLVNLDKKYGASVPYQRWWTVVLAKHQTAQWLASKPVQEWKDFYDEHGYLVVPNLLNDLELDLYRDMYDQFMSGEIDASAHRHDLGSNEERKQKSDENISQIMWPSDYINNIVRVRLTFSLAVKQREAAHKHTVLLFDTGSPALSGVCYISAIAGGRNPI